MKKVSVIIPAYNKASLTVETVNSVLAQTYSDIEIIVVDDGSTDNTRERMEQFGNRIRYVYKNNGGACSARNRGIELATGEFLAFLDCDDVYLPDKIEAAVQFFQRNPDYGLIHTAAYFTDTTGKIVGQYSHPKSRQQGWITKSLIFSNYICNSTVVVRRTALDQVGGFDEAVFVPADWDLWLRISERFKTGYIDTPLTKYRVTENYTFNKVEKSEEEEKYVLEKFFKRHPDLEGFFRNRVYSSMHLRYAQNYLLKGNMPRLREEFGLCLKHNPFNGKALGLFVYYLCARKRLTDILARKILRYNG